MHPQISDVVLKSLAPVLLGGFLKLLRTVRESDISSESGGAGGGAGDDTTADDSAGGAGAAPLPTAPGGVPPPQKGPCTCG